MGTPAAVASAVTNPGGTGSTITVSLPATQAVGDILYLWIVNSGNVLWATNPTGWSRKDQRTVGTAANGLVGTLLFRRLVSGDSLPLANPVCNLGATVTREAVAWTERGADIEGVHVLPEWDATGHGTGTANPIRPPTVTSIAPTTHVLHLYGSRSATNAPEPTGYTQLANGEVVVSGTLVCNVSERTVADQGTLLSNQDASPTSGVRWVACILSIPSPDYVYYRAGSQALTAAGTSATPALPAGTSSADNRGNKDLVIATVEAAGTPAISPNTPAHWTEIAGEWATTTSGNGTTIRRYRALYTGTLDRQFNRSTSGEIAVCLTTYRNTHQTSPVATIEAQQNASSTSSAFPALTRTATKATITAVCVADGTPSYTAPSGWTERMDGNGIVCADQIFNATGTVSSASFALSAASPTACGLVEIASVASQIVTTLTPANASITTTPFAPKLVTAIVPSASTLTTMTFAPTVQVSSGSTILTDDFDDNSRDTSKWGLGSIAFENASVGVAEANQRIEITPLANEATPAIYGYRSANAYDFTGRQAKVRIATSVTSDTEAWLVVVLDANNYFRIWVAGGILNTRTRVTSTNSNLSHGAFSFATQNHWRIRHDDDTDEIVFEAGDGSGWSELRRVARPLTITSMRVYLSGGTGGSVASPAIVTFDDFILNELTQVTPSAASLTLTTFTPTLTTVTRITPATGSLSLTTFAPTVIATEEEIVEPGTATLSTTTFAPSVRTVTRVIPAAGSLSLTGFAPRLVEAATPTTAEITTARFAPTLRTTLTPETKALAVATFAPTINVSDHVRVVPSAASLALSSFAVRLATAITPARQSLTLTSFAAIASVTQRITSTASSLTLSTFAPSIVTNTRLIPVVTTLTLTATGPTLRQVITTPAATLTLTPFVPAIIADVDVTVIPLPANLTTTGFAPAFQLRVTPATRTLTSTATAPSLASALIPSTASLTLAANSLSLSHVIRLSTTTLSLTGLAPLLPVGDDVTVAPATASLALTTFAPLALAPIPTPPRRTFVIESARRTTVVPRETRTMKVAGDTREQVLA